MKANRRTALAQTTCLVGVDSWVRCSRLLARCDAVGRTFIPKTITLLLPQTVISSPTPTAHAMFGLGMYCVGVLTGSSNAEQLKRAGADLLIAQIGELLDHV